MQNDQVELSSLQCDDSSSNWDESSSFDKSMNAYGVVFVRVLAAERLSCPTGSSVICYLYLEPFEGCGKTSRTKAHATNENQGVSAKWNNSDDDALCPMVNAWNSPDSPIPSIKIEVRFSPIGVGLLDFTMATFSVSCQPLLANPGEWKTAWITENGCGAPTEGGKSRGDQTGSRMQIQAMFTRNKQNSLPFKPTSLAVRGKKDHDEYLATEHQEAPKQIVSQNAKASIVINEERSKTADGQREHDDATAADTVHLLRVESFFVPKPCSVCRKTLFGRKSGFICEDCGIMCCGDCQLSVNFRAPCKGTKAGSEKKSESTVDRVLAIVAPDDTYDKQKRRANQPQNGTKGETISGSLKSFSVGSIRIQVLKALVLSEEEQDGERSTPSTLSHGEGREGNYYFRVASSTRSSKTWRTEGIFAAGGAHMRFREAAVEFEIEHYGEEFWIECVDTSTDEVVGASLLSVHGLMLSKREAATRRGVLWHLSNEDLQSESINPRLVLRKKAQTSLTASLAESAPRLDEAQDQTSAIVGWVEVTVRLNEALGTLYGLNPTPCPPRPSSELNVNNFQNKLHRLRVIALHVQRTLQLYHHLVQWRNFSHSATAFGALVLLCFLDIEYIACVPVCIALVIVARNFLYFHQLGVKNAFLQREAKTVEMNNSTVFDSSAASPFGMVALSIHRGRHIYSRDLGVSGKASCRVFLTPHEKNLEDIAAGEGAQEIGTTIGVLSADPDWNQSHFCSISNKRLMQTLGQSDEHYFTNSTYNVPWLRFPTFQPIAMDRRLQEARMLDWEQSRASITILAQIELGFSSETVGRLDIPLADLVKAGEVKGWFPLSMTMTQGLSVDEKDAKGPSVFLHMQWQPPRNDLSDTEYWHLCEKVQREILDSSRRQHSRPLSLVENSIGAVNTAFGVSGHLQTIQGMLGLVADTLERVETLLNFTDPVKTYLVFMGLSLVMVVVWYIKTRYLFLCLVLEEFVPSLVTKSLESSTRKGKDTEKKGTGQVGSHSPSKKRRGWLSTLNVWLWNAFVSLPTNEDLRRAFAWEIKSQKAALMRKNNASIRERKLKLLWRAKWYSEVELCTNPSCKDKQSRRSCFALIEAQRFLWWTSVTAFDAGELVDGFISLRGHSGIMATSPTDLKGLEAELHDRVTTMFGRGSDGQKKMTIVLPSLRSLESLRSTVASMSDKTD